MPGILHVAEDEIELFLVDTGKRPLRVTLGFDCVAGLAEQQPERLPETRVVLNDQQPHRSHPRLVGKP